MQNILPWQQQAWQYLLKRKHTGELPHALLIKGIRGVGKSLFVKHLAAWLLCEANSTENNACGKCSACALLQANSHPDLLTVQPEEPGKAIKIDQIREVIAALNNTAHQGGYKIVIIEEAELLNIAAANALLKTLEEPTPSTLIILISAHSQLLAATIRSRCQALLIPTPAPIVAAAWLKQHLPHADTKQLLAIAANAPLKALELVTADRLTQRQEFFNKLDNLQQGKISSLHMAKWGLEIGFEQIVLALMVMVSDLVKIKFGVPQNISNGDQLEKLTSFATHVNIHRLFAYKEQLYQIRGHLFNKINLNQQLTLENLMIRWLELGAHD